LSQSEKLNDANRSLDRFVKEDNSSMDKSRRGGQRVKVVVEDSSQNHFEEEE